MKNLEISLNKQSQVLANKWLALVFAVLGLFGFLDAALLTVKHYFGTPLSCPFFGNCEKVLTSPYATIWGIPVALGGVIYYLTIFILAIYYIDIKRTGILNLAARLTWVGLLASLSFLYIQFFVIKSVCFWCLLSAITSTLLFIFGLLQLKAKKGNVISGEHV